MTADELVTVAAGSRFNGFDAALCEALLRRPAAVALVVFLVVFLAAAFFATAVRVFVADFPVLALAARATFVATRFPVVLEDFLRVFLDIRLPFVAFRSSTIGVLRSYWRRPDSHRPLGKFDGHGVW
ncbi:hypothetical protein BSN85_30130 [Bradyrhizobium brasilense]|nr:hypothetical protein BSN85_30130 [Bradyrhizobium brasilense]